jgi:hypothetical protein
MHCRTAMVVAEQLLPGLKFTVAVQQQQQEGEGQGQGQRPQLYLVECEGAAWTAGS